MHVQETGRVTVRGKYNTSGARRRRDAHALEVPIFSGCYAVFIYQRLTRRSDHQKSQQKSVPAWDKSTQRVAKGTDSKTTVLERPKVHSKIGTSVLPY